MKYLKPLSKTMLVMLIPTLSSLGQHARVEVSKHSAAIPKSCVAVVPANLDGAVDVPALVKEAYCKGAGDMLAEYTYLTNSVRREKDKKGKEKEETYTYEVFFPTLKSGMHTKGILVVTSHNGVPVSSAELEKERLKAAEKTEKEEEKIAGEAGAAPVAESTSTTGMLPLGTYAGMGINHESFGRKRGARVAIHTYLKWTDLALVRRETVDGRETLIFRFTPRVDAKFEDNEKYIAQLTGEIWIDVQDRIVVRLIGWPAARPLEPSSPVNASNVATNVAGNSPSVTPPAVYFEMMRLNAGIWLSRVARINGADYPKLFDGITTDGTNTNSNYIHFSTEIKDVKTTSPNNP